MSDPIKDAPDEVRTFLAEAATLRAPHLGIFPLAEQASREYTTAIRRTAVGAELGLIALDDANDSNPYCYITQGFGAGMVLHFSHDPEPQLRFTDLKSFKDALTSAIANGQHIDDLEFEKIPLSQRQDELELLLLERLGRDDEVSEFMVCTFLPLLEPTSLRVLERLCNHSNFLFREAAAVLMRDRPHSEHCLLLEKLAKDTYGQVSRPAVVALKVARRLKGQS